MKNDLRTKLNTALQDVDWNGEDQVLRMIRQQQKPVRRLMPSKALVFAVVLALGWADTEICLKSPGNTAFPGFSFCCGLTHSERS